MYLTMVQGSKIIRNIKLKYYLFGESYLYKQQKRCTGNTDTIVKNDLIQSKQSWGEEE